MELRTCKRCENEKEITKFSSYVTTSGRKLRKATCYSCYNKKYRKIKLITSVYDPRFSWGKATFVEKLEQLRRVFEKNVIRKDGCWGWKGALHHTGYAVIQWDGKQIGAHQASMIIRKGSFDTNMWVLHKCDVKPCTNPAHLYIGTPQQNSQDREDRNRRLILRGMNHPNSVLTERKVKNIKVLLQNGLSVLKIAKKYKCGNGTIDAIKRGWTWRHV